MAPLEEVALEVGLEAVADHGHVVHVADVGKQLHLILGEELGLVHDDAVVLPLRHLVDVHILHQHALGLQPAAGEDAVRPVPGVRGGLHKEHAFAPFEIVIPHHEGVGALAGAHGPVAEIQLCHADRSSLK